MDPQCSQIASKPPTRTRRSRAGCQQCRKRKRKCDERHPQCLACLERNLPCNWQRDESRRPQVARRHLNPNKDFTVAQEIRPLMTIFTVPSAPIQEKLLAHFCDNSPLWLTSGGNQRSAACSGVIIPIALRNPLVLNCVLALAAGDLGKYQPASSGMASLTHGFYGQAVVGIQSALSKELSSSEAEGPLMKGSTNDDLLLAIMLLCVHETVNFTATDRIIPHLTAAATLCYSRCYNLASDVRLRGLLFEVFCYIFTLTAFSHGRNLPLHLADEILMSPFLSGHLYQGVLLGERCREVFPIILRITRLTSGTDSAVRLEESSRTELRFLADQLEARPRVQTEEDSTSTDDEIVFELYRLACLIHIRGILSSQPLDRSAQIQELLARFVSTLSTIPASSPANNILCWPLFIAGMSSVLVSHRRLIVGRLRRNYESWWRSDILSRTADYLSMKWRQDKAAEARSAPHEGIDYCHLEAQRLGGAMHGSEFPIVLL